MIVYFCNVTSVNHLCHTLVISHQSGTGTFLKKILFIYLEIEEGKEKERERNINVWLPLTCLHLGTWPSTQARALTGNRTGNPVVHRLALNLLTYTSQGDRHFYCPHFSDEEIEV